MIAGRGGPVGGVLLALALGGCLEKGDFGRPKASIWNEAVGATGAVAAAGRGEAVSTFLNTDDEAEMRDRAWRFLVPSRGRPWLDAAVAELVATRVVPPDLIEPDRRHYHAGLLGEAGRSTVSLYRRISEDAGADFRLVEPFARVAGRVLSADARRVAALARTGDLDAWDVGQARARVAENRCLVAWVAAASGFRLAAYRYALDHLFVEAPGPDAGPTERSLLRLAAERGRLDALGVSPLPAAACAGDPGPGPGSLLPAAAPALVRKG